MSAVLPRSKLPIQQQRRGIRIRTIGWTVLGSVVGYIYALLTAAPDLLTLGAGPLAFQIACWSVSLILLACWSPSGQLRLSDPGVLVMLWCAIYLVYPSVIWFQGNYIPFSIVLTLETAILLFWLHGMFFLGFIVGYLCLCRRSGCIAEKMDTRHLPSGRFFFLIPLLPLLWSILMRVASGGALFPEATYREVWLDLQANVQEARSSGGLAYLWIQIYSKVSFYPLLIQGVGAGLLLIHVRQRGRGLIQTFLLLTVGILFMLVFGSGMRSRVFIILIIALVLVDMLAGPVRWRHLILLSLVGLVVFEFFGYLRAYRDLGFDRGFQEAYQVFSASARDGDFLNEFTIMFSKEALAFDIFRSAGSEGEMYLVQSLLHLVPSQLVPGKFDILPTRDILSRELLGDFAAAGAGVAGAMVGDGYRFAGIVGVPLLAALLGAVIGSVQRWGTREAHAGVQGPILLKAILIAGVYGWTFDIIRSDLTGVIGVVLYDLVIPWVVISTLLSEKRDSVWIKPLSVLLSPHARSSTRIRTFQPHFSAIEVIDQRRTKGWLNKPLGEKEEPEGDHSPHTASTPSEKRKVAL